MEAKTDVRYTCVQCGVRDRSVSVRARTQDEDVVHWVEQVMALAIGMDHARFSPACGAQVMTEVKILVPPGSQVIGGAQLQ